MMTAARLDEIYSRGKAKADDVYGGKIVILSGVILAISKDVVNTPYVTLAGRAATFSRFVQCMFIKDDLPALAKLHIGHTITVRGRVDSQTRYVLIRDTTILS